MSIRKTSRLIAVLTLAATALQPIPIHGQESMTEKKADRETPLLQGTVTDADGEPIIGAQIKEEGTMRGTITNMDGQFSLACPAGSQITISYMGFHTVTLAAQPGMKVVMQDDAALLDEIVVVGYGSQRKVNLTGAVSTVDVEKTFGSRSEQDVARALQGAVPGLTVISNSGNLDETPAMTIRGVGTLSNGAASNPLIVVDGVPVDDMSMLNADDIESVSVLKDAASAAIYGTRAAFGVILITTRQARQGEHLNIKYSNNFAWSGATCLPDFPDVPTQLEAALRAKNRQSPGAAVELFGMHFDQLLPYAQAWARQNSGKKGYGLMRPYESDTQVGDYRFIGNQPMYYADYDIQDIWYDKTAPSQTHNVSLNGSSQRTQYYISFGYSGQKDVMKIQPGKRERFNVNMNLQTDITSWLQAGVRTAFSRQKIDQADTWANIYQYLWRWGSFFVPSGHIDGTDFRFMAMQKQADRRVTIHDQLRMTAFAKAHITRQLTLNADFTYQMDHGNRRAGDFSVTGYDWSGTSVTSLVAQGRTSTSRYNAKADTWMANAYLEYDATLGQSHHLKAMAGLTGEERTYDSFFASRAGLYSIDYPELNLTYGDPATWAIGSSTSGRAPGLPRMRGDYATAGYFARVNYDYRNTYLLELNGRYDGSSSFPGNKRWAFFPSFSAGYRFTEEPYWTEAMHQVIGNGKIRFSYGQIGNEAVGDAMYLARINSSTMDYLGADGSRLNAFSMPAWVSSDLSWEHICTMNLGLDLSFLNDQLTLTAELFQRETSDMLAPGASLPSSVGADSPYTNNGTLRSRGWELTMGFHRQIGRDLRLHASMSIGDSRVKVTRWSNDARLIGHPLDASHAYEGMYWGDIWGFETDRYFTPDDFDGQNADGTWKYKATTPDQTGLQTNQFIYGPGDIKFKDLNGDGVINGGQGTAEDHGDLKVIGNALPRYEYSFRVGAEYKGFDLNVFCQGVGRRQMWTQSAFVFPEMREADLAIYAHQTKYNVYDPQNGIVNISEKNDYPCLYPGNEYAGNVTGLVGEGGCHNYYPQTKYLVNMAYLRLKNITLGYTLPQRLTKRAYIQTLRLYASTENPCLLYKGNGDLPLDPEMNAGQGALSYGTWGRTYPITRSWSVGLQATF